MRSHVDRAAGRKPGQAISAEHPDTSSFELYTSTGGIALDIAPIDKRVIGLDVHQAQITGCAMIEQAGGSVTFLRGESLAASSENARR
jgi:hypothetical protein